MIPKERRDLPFDQCMDHRPARSHHSQVGAALFPVLILALSWDRVRFVRAAELANEAAAAGPSSPRQRAAPAAANGESTGLLSAPPLPPLLPTVAMNSNGSNANKKSAANSGHRLPTAIRTLPWVSRSLPFPRHHLQGLSVTASSSSSRIWPSKSLHLQLIAVACVILLFAARVVNFFTPLALGKLVDDLSNGRITLVGCSSLLGPQDVARLWNLLSVLQNIMWVPVEQYSDRMMSMMAFEHLLNLSMSFHTKKKTGEVLRILTRQRHQKLSSSTSLFSLLPVFIDIFVAMFYMTRTYSAAIGVALFVVMVAYTWASVQLTTWRTGLRRAMNNKDSICRAISADVLMNWETVKCYSNESYEAERFRSAPCREYQKTEFKVIGSLNMLNMVQNLILAFGHLFTIMLVAGSVVRGETTSSQFVVFVTYLQQVYQPLSMLGTLYRVVQQNLVDTDKLMTLLVEKTEVKDLPDAKDLVVTTLSSSSKTCVFSYDERSRRSRG